ncbi:AbrB/MazE/SpoVT family DNA-binding domain-containing protein [Candidatus Woesearchaeota archaeon]|nr:AbrB/MazE/SpoVT family DNA-binding domain-containing protein [Candidatus Woesearchaeota archaeon]
MIIQKDVRMGARGQIVIPKAIRAQERIRPNQLLQIIDIGGEIKLRLRSHDKQAPEDMLLEALQEAKLTQHDWEELKRQRHEVHR